jgi:ribonuclease BN (tRNA processing enzyme)
VRVRILPSSPGGGELQHLITFVVDGRLAIDAGCLGLCGTPQEQAAITSVFLTHSHADHVCSLPFFAMNVIDATGRGAVAHAPAAVVEALHEDLFNWRTWPDFTALRQDGRPMIELVAIEPRLPVACEGLTLTAIPVNHPVPTVAYVVDDGTAAVLFATDTGPTEEVWAVASRSARLKAAFIDVAFPDELADLAAITGHLTPGLARDEMAQLPAAVLKVAVHLKPALRERVAAQIEALANPNLVIGRMGWDYEF